MWDLIVLGPDFALLSSMVALILHIAYLFTLYFAVFLNCLPEACSEVKEVSACHGTQTADCDFFVLSCDPGQRIRLLSEEYGYKDYKCQKKKNKCMK